MDVSLVRSLLYRQLNPRLRAALATDYRSGEQFLTEREVTEKARVAGRKPSSELLMFGKRTACKVDESLHDASGVGPTDELWELDRSRPADGEQVILKHCCIVQPHCPRLTESQAKGLLYRTWIETQGLRIGSANDVTRAVLLSPREAKHVRTTAKSPALEVVSIGSLEDDSPLCWERTLNRGDQYEFHSRRGPMQSSTPAHGRLR